MAGTPTPPQDRFEAAGVKIGLVVSRYHAELTSKLLAGARDCLQEHGAQDADLTVLHVPGAFEIPLAAQRLSRSGQVEGIICLGLVIRGETGHFDLVAGEVSRGIGRVALDTGIPLAFGVVTAENQAQAVARCGGDIGNRGEDAALAVLEMVHLLRRLG